jgi:hypothetical protein
MDVQFPNNKDNIKAYMDAENCTLKQKSRTVTLNGEQVVVPGFRLPLHLLLYNTDNGRTADSFHKLLEANGGKKLDPTKKKDSDKIQNHLFNLAPKEDGIRTKDSLKKDGQKELAICTVDGVLLDGNRRLACLSKLFDETKNTKFGFMEVAWLEKPINKHDRYVIELGISMGMDPKVEYGPIAQLIKLDEGVKMGISEKELAGIMYGYTEAKVKDKLKKLAIMKTYLKQYFGNPDEHEKLEGLDTHFSEIQRIQEYVKYPDLETDEKMAIEEVAFRLIREGNFNHRRLRDIGKAVNKDMSLDKLVDTADKMDEFDPKNVKGTKTQVGFSDFEESVDVQEKQEEVIELVNKILNSLEYLDTTDLRLKEEETKQKVITIKKKAEKLFSDVGV